MSFQIKRGLFKFDFTDRHAILGVTVDATPEQIRERYKHIARLLHPDSCKAEIPAEKERAVQLFSKLVSPAYATLSKTRPRAEYLLVLRQMSKQLAGAATKVSIASVAAKQLAQADGNLDKLYASLVQNRAATQYESLDKVIDAIASLSELNLVYLIRTENRQNPKVASTRSATAGTTSGSATGEEKPSPQIEAYMRRAAGYIMKNNFAKAVLELRDALALEPNNSSCHSLLGMVYLKQNLTTMAKVHINKALQLNPQDARALQGKQIIAQQAPEAASGKTTTPQPSTQSKSTPQRQAHGKPPARSHGGLFGGLFGAKKK